MKTKRRENRLDQNYTEKELYPAGQDHADRNKRDYQGGVFSDSAVGGESRSQQNPWQGSQSRWEQS